MLLSDRDPDLPHAKDSSTGSRLRPESDPTLEENRIRFRLSRQKNRRLHILKGFWIQSGPDPSLFKNLLRPNFIDPAGSTTLERVTNISDPDLNPTLWKKWIPIRALSKTGSDQNILFWPDPQLWVSSNSSRWPGGQTGRRA